MYYLIEQVAEALSAQFLQKNAPAAPVEHLLFDSRQVAQPDRSLFFALVGARNDGHRYLSELYRAGVRNFVVSRDVVELADLPQANILKVANALDALQKLAAWHRQKFQIPVIGITGSNGKTIVKTWLEQLLRPDFRIVASPKSFNSQIGVPLSVWQMQPQHELAIFEAGISRPGEMSKLEAIICPTIGILTNIKSAHREGFESQQLKLEEKLRLFRRVEILIFCADHEKILAALPPQTPERGGISNNENYSFKKETNPNSTESSPPSGGWGAAAPAHFSWSKTGQPADVQILEIQKLASGFSKINYCLSAKTEHEQAQRTTPNVQSLKLPFSDDASLENACHCLAALLLLGIAPARIRRRFARLEPVEMRLELKAAINRSTLLNDFYNNDLSSLGIALAFAAQQSRERKLTLVLSDIFQSGLAADDLYRRVAAVILEKKVARLLGIGSEIRAVRKFLPKNFDCHFFATTDDFLLKINDLGFADELILLKGSRIFKFEKIARRLEQQAHKTVLEVNLSALVHNLNVFGKLLRPGTKMMAMVKASGYGSGAAEVAKLLEFHKVDYLGVAYADEGIELRQAGVRLPIMVLNPEPASLDAMLRHQLEPEVYSLRGLADLLHFLEKNLEKDRHVGIHLKLDTGMHRLGFEPADLPALLEILKNSPQIEVKSVLSHLAASDSAAHDEFTRRQATRFMEMSEQIKTALGYSPLRHLANTGGIARFPEFHFDMVRVGIGLYGMKMPELVENLQVVNTLKATISQIKTIAPGDTVGYNRSGKIARPTRIATISIGYADGFLRAAGNGKFSVLIHGRPAPTIGNVCMDMTMVDVSAIPQAREGDEVVIFGANPPVELLAAALGTIPYEIFTSISGRVKRVYFQE